MYECAHLYVRVRVRVLVQYVCLHVHVYDCVFERGRVHVKEDNTIRAISCMCEGE